MNHIIHCICPRKFKHEHVSWGGAPHRHWNLEAKESRVRDCEALHWYCLTPDCNCSYLKGLPPTKILPSAHR